MDWASCELFILLESDIPYFIMGDIFQDAMFCDSRRV